MLKQQTARLAGFIYLIVVVTGIISIAYVPSQLISLSDPLATVENIRNSERLYRVGVYTGVLCYIAFLILPFVLYKLFQETSKNAAALMIILSVVSVPLSIFNLVGKLDVLTLINSEVLETIYTHQQIGAQVMLKLRSYNNGIMITQVFWGLWLFPFGYLVYQSRLIPRVFGVLLMLGCLSYLVRFSVQIIAPEISLPSWVRLPSTLGEIGTCLWLLIMGAKSSAVEATKDNELS